MLQPIFLKRGTHFNLFAHNQFRQSALSLKVLLHNVLESIMSSTVSCVIPIKFLKRYLFFTKIKLY